jgi:hypothetical protein
MLTSTVSAFVPVSVTPTVGSAEDPPGPQRSTQLDPSRAGKDIESIAIGSVRQPSLARRDLLPDPVAIVSERAIGPRAPVRPALAGRQNVDVAIGG